MVEGPRVHTFYDTVVHTTGHKIKSVRGTTKLPHEIFIGANIVKWFYIGKYFYGEFQPETGSDKIIIRVHFMMFGRLYVNKPHPTGRKPNLEFVLDDNQTVAFYNSSVKLITQTDIDPTIKPQYDVAGLEFSRQELLAHVKTVLDDNSNEIITDFLLDQSIFPGVGNIIQQEALYRCGISPHTIVANLSPTLSIKAGISIYDGSIGTECLIDQLHLVATAMYDFTRTRTIDSGRMGQTVFQIYHKSFCPIGHKTKREIIGQKQRRVTWCRECQE
jgi:endonuclease-8